MIPGRPALRTLQSKSQFFCVCGLSKKVIPLFVPTIKKEKPHALHILIINASTTKFTLKL